MDSNKIVNPNLDEVQRDSFLAVERLRSEVDGEIQFDVGDIKEQINKSFRQFLLAEEQERMPFLQRVITSHLENMENERGFPPRHPIHWFKSKLEFSSSGVVEFDTDRETEAFIQGALQHIEAEIKAQLQTKQQLILQLIDRRIVALQQEIARGIGSIAQTKKIMATEYVNSFLRTNQLKIKVLDRFYFVSDGVRFDSHQEASYNQVCVRPGSRLGLGKQSQVRFAVSCDRLLNIVNQSLDRSIGQLQQQTNDYLQGDVRDRLEELFMGLRSGSGS
jgi:hypothetical protein